MPDRDDLLAPADTSHAAPLRVHLDPAAVVRAYGRHRRRFAASVTSLDEAALRTPSRCSEWTVADVLRHELGLYQLQQFVAPCAQMPAVLPEEF